MLPALRHQTDGNTIWQPEVADARFHLNPSGRKAGIDGITAGHREPKPHQSNLTRHGHLERPSGFNTRNSILSLRSIKKT